MTDENMTIDEAAPPQMPDFFRGMACAYEDCAQFIEHMRDNLPAELRPMMEGGFTTIAQGFRAKIDTLVVTVAQNMAKLDAGEGSAEQ